MNISKQNIRIIISYALLIIWAGVIFMLSSEGSDTSSGRSDAIVETVQTLGIGTDADLLTFLVRKSAHIIAYFIFGLLAFNLIRLYKLPLRRTALTALAVVFIYAVSDEFHQYFVSGRSSEIRDVLIDTTAGLLGIGIFALIYSRLRAKHLNKKSK